MVKVQQFLALLLSFWVCTVQAKTLTVGTQAGGTLSWVVYAIGYYGIDKELNLDVKMQTYASKDATRIALKAGEAQIVVDDFIETVLLRQRGFPVKAVYPFSLITGGIVVPSNSDTKTLCDLKNKTLGATSLTDKTLLLVRALSIKKCGFDMQDAAKVAAASSPLMGQLLDKKELDAAIPLWHHGARLLGTGKYRELVSTEKILTDLGLPKNIPLLYIVARDDADPATLSTFIKAIELANSKMKADDGKFWDAILEQGLYAVPQKSQMQDVRKKWQAGLPKKWDSSALVDTRVLIEKLLKVTDSSVLGIKRFDVRAFSTVNSKK